MKKMISVILACLLLALPLCVTAYALPLSDGTAKLNRQFQNGRYGDYDYVFFSPVKGEDDPVKYPLTVWLHGRNSGGYPRAQLERYAFSNWASDEYQARFENAGGCFLLCPRASVGDKNEWDNGKKGDLKAIIDGFIAQNADHIDTSRVYLAGYSTGGTMVWNMLTAYPGFFAAGLPLAAIGQPTASGLKKLTDVSVWVFTSDNDPYIINETGDVKPNFDYLCGVSHRPDGLRMTSFTEAFFADGTKKTDGGKLADDAEHYIWESVTYDMFMEDGVTPYKCATTIDADGNVLTFSPGQALIAWLSRQTNEKADNGKVSLLTRLSLFFKRLMQLIREMYSFILG
ncbi:MAG: prolyl oligopeptidase family serine peptidase [Clostridia bacterium]|nr:prolyl oligopeptidase family serine peptidase [Clostridia bacterium]